MKKRKMKVTISKASDEVEKRAYATLRKILFKKVKESKK
jgi:hypothetical protein